MNIEYSQVSCFQDDIGPISKIFEICLDGSSSFVGAVFPKNVNHLEFEIFEICKNNISSVMFVFFVFWFF